MAETTEEFWRFSLSLYQRPGVAAACIALQDDHGSDVNLALFCAWVGACGRGRLGTEAIKTADRLLEPWRRRVVEPLRGARRSIKAVDGAEQLYIKIKAIELEAERHAHDLLAGLAPAVVTPHPPPQECSAAACANLVLYIGDSAAPAAAPILAAMAELIDATAVAKRPNLM